jgi:hypothetical protein
MPGPFDPMVNVVSPASFAAALNAFVGALLPGPRNLHVHLHAITFTAARSFNAGDALGPFVEAADASFALPAGQAATFILDAADELGAVLAGGQLGRPTVTTSDPSILTATVNDDCTVTVEAAAGGKPGAASFTVSVTGAGGLPMTATRPVTVGAAPAPAPGPTPVPTPTPTPPGP